MNVDFGLAGKKYLITGASSGIGRTAAIKISQFGGKVVLSGRNEDRLYETLYQMDGEGHQVMPYDLADLDGIKEYVEKCIEVDGCKFDGLVYSAGIANPLPIRIERMSNLQHIMTVNYYAYFAFLKEFSSQKKLNNGGAIVAVSSCASLHPDKGQFSYASSKVSMDISSEVAAQEFAKRKIRVNTVNPHMTRTQMTAYYFEDPAIQETLGETYPLGVLIPDDVVNTIVFLLSDLSSKITGQHIYLSAGNDGSHIDYLI